MVFTSAVFLFVFLPVVVGAYYFCRPGLRNIVLLLSSLLFYAWGEPYHIVLMLLSIVVNYLICLLMEKFNKIRIFLLFCAIVFDLGILFYFKYFNFTVDTLNRFFSSGIAVGRIALPVGISFYTFQMLSYIIDVYRGNVQVQRNIANLALYISLFPQLIAGPIVRYADVESQIRSRELSLDKVYSGVIRFMQGFSKKVLLADQLAPLVDVVFQGGGYLSVYLNWIGAVGYTLQIYFDFSGYSDMAIGMGRIFGFEFMENFNYPYISKSIKEFWRRWHISLSTWFRDYVYIPLGGSRCTKWRAYLNLLIVFFLTGLWHGASFHFIAWGMFYAILLFIERMGWGRMLEKLPCFFRHFYTMIAVIFGWVVFRAEHMRAVVQYIKGMFMFQGDDWNRFLYVMNRQYWFCLAVGFLCIVPYTRIKVLIRKWKAGQIVYNVATISVFILAICYMTGSGVSPFLYFRF